MDLHPFSLQRAPSYLPNWQLILDDLGRPTAERIAKVLGISERTVRRWSATGRPPKWACLALFWLTRWGHSQVHTQATNDAALYASLARALQDERRALQHQIHRLLRLGDFSQVNDPTIREAIESTQAIARTSKRKDGCALPALPHVDQIAPQSCRRRYRSGQLEADREAPGSDAIAAYKGSGVPPVAQTEGVTRTFRPGAASRPCRAPLTGSAATLTPAEGFVQRVIKATNAAPITTFAARSIFDAGAHALTTALTTTTEQDRPASPIASPSNAERPKTGSPGRERPSRAREPSAHAPNASTTPASLPLAEQVDTRPGTPASAPAASPALWGPAPSPPLGHTKELHP